MATEGDHIARLYLFVATVVLALATGYVYFNYGFGFGVGLLGILTVLAFWGTTSRSSGVREFLATLFSS